MAKINLKRFIIACIAIALTLYWFDYKILIVIFLFMLIIYDILFAEIVRDRKINKYLEKDKKTNSPGSLQERKAKGK